MRPPDDRPARARAGLTLAALLAAATLAAASAPVLSTSRWCVAAGEAVTFTLQRGQPFLGATSELRPPQSVVVHGPGVTFVDLGRALEPLEGGGFQATYTPAAAGDHILALHAEPQMIDGEFVLDFAKLILHVGDVEEGWDRVLGHRLEVVPLTRPYGLPVGATFRAQVLTAPRQPAAGILVRIERRNEAMPNPLPPDPWRARVEKTSAAGELVTSFDKAGDWTLIARMDGRVVPRGSQSVREVLRAILWVHVGE